MTRELLLLRSISEVNDNYLRFAEDACPAGTHRDPIRLKWIAIAACLAVLLAGCVGVMSVYIPPKEPPEVLDEFVMYSPGSLTWLEYEGRTYSFYQIVSTHVMTVGDKLGEGVCTRPNYENIAQQYSRTGELRINQNQAFETIMLYAVKGIDPSFMVTSAYGNVYICDGDITLTSGADIFEKRLRLKERYVRLEHSGWVDGEPEQLVVEEQYHDEFETFLEALCAGQCVSIDDVTRTNGKRVFVMLDNGLQVILMLYDGGYVQFPSLNVAVQMDTDAFDVFRGILKDLEGSPWKKVTYPDWEAIKAEKEKQEAANP